jgi:CTP:phosphocholine cytidylyltransferase-like protein
MLLKEDVNIDVKNNFSLISLSYMAWRGSEAVVKLLLENTINMDSKDIYCDEHALRTILAVVLAQ